MTFASEIQPFNQRSDALVNVHADRFKVKFDKFHTHIFSTIHIRYWRTRYQVPIKKHTFNNSLQIKKSGQF